MMGLDSAGILRVVAAGRLDDVRIEGALGEESGRVAAPLDRQAGSLHLEDEAHADVACASAPGRRRRPGRSGIPPWRRRRPGACPGAAGRSSTDLLGLALAEQAVVHKAQVRRSPMARCTSVAATSLSTPPLRPQMTWPMAPPTSRYLHRILDEVAGRPVAAATADALDEVAEEANPLGHVHDLGVELDPVEPALVVGDRGQRRVAAVGDGQGIPAAGIRHDRSWFIFQTCSVGGRSAKRALALRRSPQTSIVADPYSRSLEGATWPPSAAAAAAELQAVADAQHGHTGLDGGAGKRRRPRLVDAAGSAPKRVDPLRPHPRQHFLRPVPGDQLGVDARLTPRGGR